MATENASKRAYKLMNILAGDSDQSTQARAMCHSIPNRIELFTEYGVPSKHPGDPGFFAVHYEQGDTNFNAGITQIIQEATQTLVGEPYWGEVRRRVSMGDWEQTALFGFLYELSTNDALYQQFQTTFRSGTPEQQQAFLDKHLPTNYYGEQNAISKLFAATPDQEPLAQAVNKIVSTFNASYQFLC